MAKFGLIPSFVCHGIEVGLWQFPLIHKPSPYSHTAAGNGNDLEPVSEWQVFKLLDTLSRTASGMDKLPAWFLCVGAPLFYITEQLATNPYIVVLAVDFSKAFDTVRHTALFHKIGSLDIPDSVYNWMVDFFHWTWALYAVQRLNICYIRHHCQHCTRVSGWSCVLHHQRS